MATISELNKRSLQLAKRSADLANDIHKHMVDIVIHFKEHGDASAASFLYNNLHSASRRVAIANWFVAFAGMNFRTENNQGKFTRNKSIPFEQIDIQKCKDESPWEFTPEPEPRPFDLHKMLESIVRRAHKAREEHPELQHNIPDDELKVLERLVNYAAGEEAQVETAKPATTRKAAKKAA